MLKHLQQRGAALVALQETQRPSYRHSTFHAAAPSAENGPWRHISGVPPPNAYVARRARAGGTDRRVHSTRAKQGGVALMSQHAAVDTGQRDPTVAALYRSSRWAEMFVPIPRPQRRGVPNGFFVASMYAQANTDNTQLFGQVWEAAARAGNAPYFICMDANIDIRDNGILTLAPWFNAGG